MTLAVNVRVDYSLLSELMLFKGRRGFHLSQSAIPDPVGFPELAESMYFPKTIHTPSKW